MGSGSCLSGKYQREVLSDGGSCKDETDWALYRGWIDGGVNFDLLGGNREDSLSHLAGCVCVWCRNDFNLKQEEAAVLLSRIQRVSIGSSCLRLSVFHNARLYSEHHSERLQLHGDKLQRKKLWLKNKRGNEKIKRWSRIEDVCFSRPAGVLDGRIS